MVVLVYQRMAVLCQVVPVVSTIDPDPVPSPRELIPGEKGQREESPFLFLFTCWTSVRKLSDLVLGRAPHSPPTSPS